MSSVATGSASPGYRDPSLSLADRVEDLLARMTIAEKLAQIGSVWVFQLADDEGLRDESARELLADGIGQITRVVGASTLGWAEAARVANAIQGHLVHRTRLGIPAIIHE